MLLCPLTLWAQITTTTMPEGPYNFTSIRSLPFRKVDLPHNSPETIRKELFDDAMIRRIGKAVGVSDECLATVRLRMNPEEQNDLRGVRFKFHWLDAHDKESRVLMKALQAYVTARNEGHTKEFMQAALTNITPPAEIEDAGIRAIVEEHPLIPASRLKKDGEISEYTATVGGKEVRLKSVMYDLVDGDIGWRYCVDFDAGDGRVFSVFSSRYDPKGFDEKYAEVFKQVAAEVQARMKKEGSAGKFGSCHIAWRYQKELLAKRGIIWRSPSELNPGSNYD